MTMKKKTKKVTVIRPITTYESKCRRLYGLITHKREGDTSHDAEIESLRGAGIPILSAEEIKRL